MSESTLKVVDAGLEQPAEQPNAAAVHDATATGPVSERPAEAPHHAVPEPMLKVFPGAPAKQPNAADPLTSIRCGRISPSRKTPVSKDY